MFLVRNAVTLDMAMCGLLAYKDHLYVPLVGSLLVKITKFIAMNTEFVK